MLLRLRHSLQFKLGVGFLVTLVALLASMVLVLELRLRAQLEEESLKQVETNGERIVAELLRQSTLINTLAQNLANFSTSAASDPESFKRTLPALLEISDENNLIAGGGYWPEPYAFNSDVERRSFFWGKNPNGQLEYFDDYNTAEGAGYHHEEWYVPAQFLKPGQCYWSRSYIDPHSLQPMVTCTIAVKNANAFNGATTIDMKLEGLTEFFRTSTEGSGGYAFAVDQNNKFITYPSNNMIKLAGSDENIFSAQLAQRDDRFKPIAQALKQVQNNLLQGSYTSKVYDARVANLLTQNSYQIDPEQAAVIAATLADPFAAQTTDSLLLSRISLDNDPIMNEEATASIFHVPGAYWKVVVVTPKQRAFAQAQTIVKDVMHRTLIPILAIMSLAFIGLRKLVIKPINSITAALKTSAKTPGDMASLDEDRFDEWGQLAFWYNRRCDDLKKAMNSLTKVNDELSYQASYDSLTNLANRRAFEKHLQMLINEEIWSQHSLLYLDIDQFKVVNDTCGHIAGDQLLIEISQLLREVVRTDDLLSRIGGDEFTIIARGESENVVRQLAERIRACVEAYNFNWEGKSFPVTCSIGVLQLDDVIQDATTALKYVDTACYAAKDGGRNRVHFYRPDDTIVMQREGEMSWMSRIKEALENDKLFVEFQLIAPTDLQKNQRCSMEALVRMKDKHGNTIPPGAFLPAAERYNSIVKIDNWVIDKVMSQLSSSPQLLEQIRYCAINLSADSLCHDNLISFIQEKLAEYELPASCLCFEITETQVMHNIGKAKAALQELHELGALIALDDFGAGMSSYGYLMELPVDLLKIDGQFIRHMGENAVYHAFVKSISEIATAMGLETIAEFVEDQSIYQSLYDIGVDYAQGFSIARPQAMDQVIESLQRHYTAPSEEPQAPTCDSPPHVSDSQKPDGKYLN